MNINPTNRSVADFFFCRAMQTIADRVWRGELDHMVSAASDIADIHAVCGGYDAVIDAIDDWLFNGPFAWDFEKRDAPRKMHTPADLVGLHKVEKPSIQLDVVTPFGFIDETWCNNTCLSFVRGCYTLWVDYPNPEDREIDGGRYLLQLTDDERTYEADLFHSDSYEDVLAFIATLPPCRERPELAHLTAKRGENVAKAKARKVNAEAQAQAYQGPKRFIEISKRGVWREDDVLIEHLVEQECVITGITNTTYAYKVVRIIGEVGRPPHKSPALTGWGGECIKALLDGRVRWIKEQQ